MLGEVQQRLEEGLEEAIVNNDNEAAAEYQEELQRLRPLPETVAPVSGNADYKRWIDPNSLL